MSEPSETCRVTYWVYSPGGDAILSVPDYAEALAYAQEVDAVLGSKHTLSDDVCGRIRCYRGYSFAVGASPSSVCGGAGGAGAGDGGIMT